MKRNKISMIRHFVAVVGIAVLAAPSPAHADAYDHGRAFTFTLVGTCGDAPTTVVHGPGSTSVGFVDGRATIARRLVFYAPDGTTPVFVQEHSSYAALAGQQVLTHCDLVLSLTGGRVEAWVQVPAA